MILGIDHLVVACPDPDAAAAELEAQIGLRCTGGGRHPNGGTRNRIAWLADGTYIELLGIDDVAAARGTPVGHAATEVLDGSPGGLATWALRSDTVETTADALRAAGGRLGPVTHGSRRRDDGELVEWWVAFPEDGLGPDRPPFLIQHAVVGSEWGPSALAERAKFRHPIGSPVILARLDLATDEPTETAAMFHEQLQIDFWAVADLAVADIGPHVVRLRPRREMPVPAVVTIGAEVETPRSVELLGMRFDVERVELPVASAATD
jgi:Glyoxalase-like domain